MPAQVDITLTGTLLAVEKAKSVIAPVARLAKSDDGKTTEFAARLRIDTPKELDYYQHGGILQYVLRQLAATTKAA